MQPPATDAHSSAAGGAATTVLPSFRNNMPGGRLAHMLQPRSSSGLPPLLGLTAEATPVRCIATRSGISKPLLSACAAGTDSSFGAGRKPQQRQQVAVSRTAAVQQCWEAGAIQMHAPTRGCESYRCVASVAKILCILLAYLCAFSSSITFSKIVG